jgi:hypothetical protein
MDDPNLGQYISSRKQQDFECLYWMSIMACFIIATMANIFSGGARGIIQLEILRLIEKELSGKIPLQLFFDLIVGSG